mgnify:CR=1 FL=1
MNYPLIGICLYIVVQFAIGLWVARRINRETDYILAGRQLGTTLATFSVFATWFGAETVLGSGGRVYSDGLAGAQAEPFAYGVAVVLMGFLFAAPLRRRGFTTFADLFAERYGAGVERLTVLLLIPGSILWAAAQIRGFGQVASTAAGMDVGTGIAIGYATVVLYTVTGGLLADVYTDFVQGLAVIIGLVTTLVFVIIATGNPIAALAAVEPQRFLPFTPGQTPLSFIEEWTVPICGSLVAIELISRLLACRTPQIAQRASYWGGAAYLLFAMIPVYLGLIGKTIMPGLEEPEQFIPALAREHLPTIGYILFAGALISAILSTVDSALLACSALISHNVVQNIWRIENDRSRVWLARAGVAALGTVAFILAMSSAGIGELVELASAFGTAGVIVVTVFALFTRIGGAASAYATLLIGASVWVIAGPLFFDISAPYTTAVLMAAIGYPLIALIEGYAQNKRRIMASMSEPDP